jgi:hypothetical protein
MFELDEFALGLAEEEEVTGNIAAMSELDAEILAFDSLKPADMQLGVVGGKFEPLVFWANLSIQSKMRRHYAVARSFFAARGSEDTSERTLSYATRQLSDLRGRTDPAQISASVMNHAADKNFNISAEEIWAEYVTKRG